MPIENGHLSRATSEDSAFSSAMAGSVDIPTGSEGDPAGMAMASQHTPQASPIKSAEKSKSVSTNSIIVSNTNGNNNNVKVAKQSTGTGNKKVEIFPAV